MSIISIQGVTKFYGRLKALDQVSFEVPEQSVFGILGPNGSGKTTLLGIILGVLKANSGGIYLFDAEPEPSQRKRIGTLLETPNFYHYLSAYDNLALTASIRGCPDAELDTVLEQVGLISRKRSRFSQFSLGMKQRLAIGAALIGDPPVLILDEPTNGLDPAGIAEIRSLIIRLATTGKTILMASHLLDEVEKVCSHVAILKMGKLLVAGAVDEVLFNEDIVELGCSRPEVLETIIPGYAVPFKSLRRSGNFIQVIFQASVSTEDLNQYCFHHGVILDHLLVRKKSLESKFIELTS